MRSNYKLYYYKFVRLGFGKGLYRSKWRSLHCLVITTSMSSIYLMSLTCNKSTSHIIPPNIEIIVDVDSENFDLIFSGGNNKT